MVCRTGLYYLLYTSSRFGCRSANDPGFTISRKFKSYIGLQGAEHKLRRLLSDFSFTDISTAAATIDWDKVPIVNL